MTLWEDKRDEINRVFDYWLAQEQAELIGLLQLNDEIMQLTSSKACRTTHIHIFHLTVPHNLSYTKLYVSINSNEFVVQAVMWNVQSQLTWNSVHKHSSVATCNWVLFSYLHLCVWKWKNYWRIKFYRH